MNITSTQPSTSIKSSFSAQPSSPQAEEQPASSKFDSFVPSSRDGKVSMALGALAGAVLGAGFGAMNHFPGVDHHLASEFPVSAMLAIPTGLVGGCMGMKLGEEVIPGKLFKDPDLASKWGIPFGLLGIAPGVVVGTALPVAIGVGLAALPTPVALGIPALLGAVAGAKIGASMA